MSDTKLVKRRPGRSHLVARKGVISRVTVQRCAYCGEKTAELYAIHAKTQPDMCKECYLVAR